MDALNFLRIFPNHCTNVHEAETLKFNIEPQLPQQIYLAEYFLALSPEL